MIIIGEKINGAIPNVKQAISERNEALIVERTLALDSMKETIAAIKAAGLCDVKVIIGGCPVTEDAANAMGADEWAYSPQKTVKVCTAWAAET